VVDHHSGLLGISGIDESFLIVVAVPSLDVLGFGVT
jgi:hypothetical protein